MSRPRTAQARALRRAQTREEAMLGAALRTRRFAGYKFRRQQPIPPYIVDFCCFEARLVVELDGDGHALPQRWAGDTARDADLTGRGYEVLRFPNTDVRQGLDGVLMVILAALQERAPHAPPAPGSAD